MILVIDNYDSFTYNLVQYLGELGADPQAYRNDQIDLDGIERLQPDAIVISPGPGTPEDAGVSLEAIRRFAGRVPILGVCLGHQCIAAAFGGRVVRARELMHGKVSTVVHDGRGIFAGVPSPLTACRYHSLIVERETLPDCLEVSAETEGGDIMGLRHRSWPVEGVQFHPESVLTQSGKDMLANFLRLVGRESNVYR
ncbi:MAG: anthranilate synthase component 2 [Firmicutes bacterium ZCTH02-B6]|nr:MAG: anthranilate synthase component 2 [Firmicutes bacterium ZCTH02-B6]